jgi:seryl-tRNA synthetase
MLDIKIIRENPAALDLVLSRRKPGAEPLADALLALHKTSCHWETELQRLRQIKNSLSDWNPNLTDAQRIERIEESKSLKTQEDHAIVQARAAKEAFEDALIMLPNWIASDVPDGASEEDNKEIHRWGVPGQACEGFKDHGTWGRDQGLLDVEQAGVIAGARFAFLLGDLARLERALGQWMLDVQTQKFGFTEMAVPYLVRQNAVFGAGQWPKFKEDLFVIPENDHDRFLIPTAEVPLANWVANKILTPEQLPLRLTALTPCFRSEAGAAGKDSTGLLRQHQFNKVELVVVCLPEDVDHWHDQMRKQAEFILESLDLPYRTVVLCAGDMGASAEKTYDIEVWVPSQNRYREIASCSRCGEYQARRMNARFRKADGKTAYVHTLNGSGLPTGRTLLAILENFQCADGTVRIPPVLQPYMGGKTSIGSTENTSLPAK